MNRINESLLDMFLEFDITDENTPFDYAGNNSIVIVKGDEVLHISDETSKLKLFKELAIYKRRPTKKDMEILSDELNDCIVNFGEDLLLVSVLEKLDPFKKDELSCKIERELLNLINVEDYCVFMYDNLMDLVTSFQAFPHLKKEVFSNTFIEVINAGQKAKDIYMGDITDNASPVIWDIKYDNFMRRSTDSQLLCIDPIYIF